MDTALTLRMAWENKKILPDSEISYLLNQSRLAQKLTKDYAEHPLFAVFRIMGLCEIPFAQSLPYTKKLISYINKEIATAEGFSCLGGVKEIVPCYNAMLFEAYCRLGLSETAEAQAALNWIKQYQLFDRGQKTSWPHGGICKHGGCLGKTPCYIGIGKTLRALITYSQVSKKCDTKTKELILQGTDYMLRHKMYRRLSDGNPISAHITDIMMPQSYALSLTDLVYIVGKQKITHEQNAAPLLSLLKEKELSAGLWKIDYRYSYKGYVAFDTGRKASEWVSNLFPIWLGEK